MRHRSRCIPFAAIQVYVEHGTIVGAARLLATAFLSSNAMLCQKWYSMSRQRAALLALRCAGAASAVLMESTGRTRGRLAALRTARAFGVWAGGAAAVNLWLRAALARWAQSKSWAFVQWVGRAARWREVRAVLLQASVVHRRRASRRGGGVVRSDGAAPSCNGMCFPVAGRDDDESAVLLARGGVGGGDGGGCDGSVYSCGGASSIGVGVGGATSAGEARGLC